MHRDFEVHFTKPPLACHVAFHTRHVRYPGQVLVSAAWTVGAAAELGELGEGRCHTFVKIL